MIKSLVFAAMGAVLALPCVGSSAVREEGTSRPRADVARVGARTAFVPQAATVRLRGRLAICRRVVRRAGEGICLRPFPQDAGLVQVPRNTEHFVWTDVRAPRKGSVRFDYYCHRLSGNSSIGRGRFCDRDRFAVPRAGSWQFWQGWKFASRKRFTIVLRTSYRSRPLARVTLTIW